MFTQVLSEKFSQFVNEMVGSAVDSRDWDHICRSKVIHWMDTHRAALDGELEQMVVDWFRRHPVKVEQLLREAAGKVLAESEARHEERSLPWWRGVWSRVVVWWG